MKPIPDSTARGRRMGFNPCSLRTGDIGQHGLKPILRCYLAAQTVTGEQIQNPQSPIRNVKPEGTPL